jgi:formylglycine-generating enzyme required for sulfatase activity
LAEEQQKARLAAEAEARRLAEEARLAEIRAAEEKRAAEQKSRIELARVNPETKPPDAPPKPALANASPSSGLAEFTNVAGMVLVQLPAGYWVGKYEVTQAEYERVMKKNPSTFKDPAHPVETVNWDDAMDFCRKLTSLESSTGRLQEGWAYTLPSESQWAEFVADADLTGAVTSFQRANAKRINPEPVGSSRANRLGLFDVRGNVWEWCRGSGDQKVLRGGGFEDFTEKGLAPTLSVPYRWILQPEQRRPQAGFRCVLVQQP